MLRLMHLKKMKKKYSGCIMYIYFLSLGLNTITFQILAPLSNGCVYKCLGNRSTNHLTLCCVWRCRVAGSGCPGAGGGSCNYIVEPMMVQGGSSPPPPHTSQLSGFLMILLKLSCQSTKFQQSSAAAQTIQRWWGPALSWQRPAPGPRANQCYYAATPVVCGRTRSRCPAQPDPHHYHPITSISVSG